MIIKGSGSQESINKYEQRRFEYSHRHIIKESLMFPYRYIVGGFIFYK
jgi:hypothetical protein